MGRGLEGFGVDIHFWNVFPGSYLAKSWGTGFNLTPTKMYTAFPKHI